MENKYNRGNITILVLVLALVIILVTASMVTFVFRDINFVKIDEGNLRALNFAEAGIADFQHQLAQHIYEEVDLPSSGYTQSISGTGSEEGSFTVTYEEVYEQDSLSGYNVASIGTDKNGAQRTVKVLMKIVHSGTSDLDIYDFIYSHGSVTLSGDGKPFDGSFYTEGNLRLEGSSGMIQSYSSGPIIIEGNLTLTGDTSSITTGILEVGGDMYMDGSTTIKEAKVNVGGNLTMIGDARINYGLQTPMIVMGDIYMDGSTQIGEAGEDLTLSCKGSITQIGAPIIYGDIIDELTYEFQDPGYDVGIVIDEYISNVQDSALYINGDIDLYDGAAPYNMSSGENSISFTEEGGEYVLEVNGNVLIDGKLTLGKERWWPEHTNIYYYRGKGIIYTSGELQSYVKLMPEDISKFPQEYLLIFISGTSITMDIFNFWGTPDCESPNLYTVAIAREDLKLKKGSLKGTVIAGQNLIVDMDFARICYLDDLKDFLPMEDLPQNQSSVEQATIIQENWQEIKE